MLSVGIIPDLGNGLFCCLLGLDSNNNYNGVRFGKLKTVLMNGLGSHRSIYLCKVNISVYGYIYASVHEEKVHAVKNVVPETYLKH
jgi:hypothetical protein